MKNLLKRCFVTKITHGFLLAGILVLISACSTHVVPLDCAFYEPYHPSRATNTLDRETMEWLKLMNDEYDKHCHK